MFGSCGRAQRAGPGSGRMLYERRELAARPAHRRPASIEVCTTSRRKSILLTSFPVSFAGETSRAALGFGPRKRAGPSPAPPRISAHPLHLRKRAGRPTQGGYRMASSAAATQRGVMAADLVANANTVVIEARV